MEPFKKIFMAFGIILVIAVSLSGCSDSPDTSVPETVAVTTAAGPLFTPGDIVRSASGSESPAWLVVGYDAGTDSYTRALIYKNADGTYGYRTSPATETSKRATMEKVYTVTITHVAADTIPTAAPATATTVMTMTTTARTTTAPTGTATTTASSARPSIKAMIPEEGEAGTTVIAEITGKDLMSNLTAMLRHSGETSITASRVSWYSTSSVTCTFDLPNTTKVGTWDIVVTNPNGLSTEYTNYFMVRGNGTED